MPSKSCPTCFKSLEKTLLLSVSCRVLCSQYHLVYFQHHIDVNLCIRICFSLCNGHFQVHFNEEVTIHNLEAWDGASRAARDGSCWMELARDRERFRRRVEKTGEIISLCLAPQHRARVLNELLNHSDGVLAV